MPNPWIWTSAWVVIVLSAVVGAVLARRADAQAPLGWALLVAAVSLAVGGVVLQWSWSDQRVLWIVTHVVAGLSLAWMVACASLAPRLRRPIGGHDALAIMQFWAVACGMVAVIVLLYVAVFEVAYRTVGYAAFLYRPRRIPLIGLADLAAVFAAACIGLRLTGDRALVTLLFWLAILGSVWCALLGAPVEAPISTAGVPIPPVPTAWPLTAQVGAALTVAVFAIARWTADRQRRVRAWPHALERLTEPSDLWPGFRLSLGIVGVAVLVIGCLMLPRWLVAPAAAAASFGLFLLVSHRWSENIADTAIALATLAVVALVMVGDWAPRRTPADYPALFNRAVFGLAVMCWLWYWLSCVWQQQLHDGRAWTAAGRMIPVAQRVAYLLGAVGVLAAFELAAWPRFTRVTDPDRSMARWIAGPAAIGLLAVGLAHASHRTRKVTVAWLSVLALVALGVFLYVRGGGSRPQVIFTQYAPLWLLALAPAALMARVALRRSHDHPFGPVLERVAILLAPTAAVMALVAMPPTVLDGPWVRQATLASVAAWYVLTSLYHPWRDLIWLALAFANVAGIDFWLGCGFSIQWVSSVAAIQVIASGLVLSGVYRSALRTAKVRAVAGAAILAAAVLTALVLRYAPHAL